jgi:hypothetical protein
VNTSPLNEALGRRYVRRPAIDTPFQKVAEDALATFRAARTNVEKRVKTGDLTLKAAREEVAQAAALLRESLASRSNRYSPVSSVFAERLADGAARRAEANRRRGLEDLQKETNELLKKSLVEQQIQARSGEFEGITHVRPIAGGQPATSVDRMLAFHEDSTRAGDDAGREWARRQLEGLRSRAYSEEEQLQIDRACQRPDRVNERLVSATIDDLDSRGDSELEVYVTHALESLDATSCVAAFILARRATDPIDRPWVRRILQALESFPDAALASLADWETKERIAEAEAARTYAEYAIELADSEAKLKGLRPPTEIELTRLSRLANLPLSRPSSPALQTTVVGEEPAIQTAIEIEQE